MLLPQIEILIGEIPSGYDPVIFVAGVLVLLYLLDCFYGIIRILCGHFLR